MAKNQLEIGVKVFGSQKTREVPWHPGKPGNRKLIYDDNGVPLVELTYRIVQHRSAAMPEVTHGDVDFPSKNTIT